MRDDDTFPLEVYKFAIVKVLPFKPGCCGAGEDLEVIAADICEGGKLRIDLETGVSIEYGYRGIRFRWEHSFDGSSEYTLLSIVAGNTTEEEDTMLVILSDAASRMFHKEALEFLQRELSCIGKVKVFE